MALTKLNNKSVANVTSIPVALGDMVLVSSATASSSASIEFTLGNYKEYQFYFVDIHPQVDNQKFQVGFRDGDTNYDAIKTSTVFQSLHNEGDTEAVLQYEGGLDLAQSTGAQALTSGIGSDADQSGCGYLHLFNPSSTTYVKQYIARCQVYNYSNYSIEHYTAGYINTTTAIDSIQFSMTSGNIDAGTILMYGLN